MEHSITSSLPCRNNSGAGAQKLHKNRYQSFSVFPDFDWFLNFYQSNLRRTVVSCNKFPEKINVDMKYTRENLYKTAKTTFLSKLTSKNAFIRYSESYADINRNLLKTNVEQILRLRKPYQPSLYNINSLENLQHLLREH